MEDKKDTDFGNDAADPAPMSGGRLGGINDWIFSMMRPKRAISAKPKQISQDPLLRLRSLPDGEDIEEPQKPLIRRISQHISPQRESPSSPHQPLIEIPPLQEVQNGLLIQKKSFIDRAKAQLKFPKIAKTIGITNGAALLVFAVGAYILYANLPTHPELVVGIILVSIAGNVIISQR
jgi:hypothetical protein